MVSLFFNCSIRRLSCKGFNLFNLYRSFVGIMKEIALCLKDRNWFIQTPGIRRVGQNLWVQYPMIIIYFV